MLFNDYFGGAVMIEDYANETCKGMDEREVFDQVLSDLRVVQSSIEVSERLEDGADGNLSDVAGQIAQEVYDHMTEPGEPTE